MSVTLQRAPTEEELAVNLEMEVEDLQGALAEIGRSGIAALDEFIGSDSQTSVGEMIADPNTVSPESAYQTEEARRGLVDEVNKLPERDRLVVTLYYYEGMTLAEIGDVLGVTESRVCQIHAKTMMGLIANTAVALIAGAAAIGGRPTATGTDATCLARCTELSVIA